MSTIDTFNTKRQLNVNNITYHYFSLPALEEAGLTGIATLPHTLKIILENLLRHEDNLTVKAVCPQRKKE